MVQALSASKRCCAGPIRRAAPIPPARFVPVAEQMGLIGEVGAFVLKRALAEAGRWPDLYIAVNLSPLQVRDRGIVDLVRGALEEAGVAPSRLVLEITEGVLIDNPDEVRKRMQDLRAIGVRIALDDFGSGYSSLGYLQRFPFDKLKIDRSFVDALGRSSNAGVIVQAIVALGPRAGRDGGGGRRRNRRAAGSAAPGRLRRDAGLPAGAARARGADRQAARQDQACEIRRRVNADSGARSL